MAERSIKTGVTLRTADFSEAEALYKMRAQSFETTYKSSVSPDILKSLMWGYSPSEFALAVQSNQIFVVEMQGDIAGFVWIDVAHGKELVVNPKYYGSGLARYLLIEGVRILLERTTEAIEIYATPNTVNWYKRFGFDPVESVIVQHHSDTRIPLEKMILNRDDAIRLTQP